MRVECCNKWLKPYFLRELEPEPAKKTRSWSKTDWLRNTADSILYLYCTIAYVFLVENVCLCLACWSFSRWKELGRVLS